MTEHPIEHASHSAQQALTTHGQASLDVPADPIDEPWWPQTHLTTLLRDLAHYADTHALDFEAALREARSWYQTDLAEQLRYQPGDEVKLRNTPHQGIVVALSSNPNSPLYEVRIIGKPYRRHLKPADLAPASAFPSLTIDGTHLLTAATAERAFQHHMTRFLHSPSPEHTRNCQLLAEALSAWSGIPRDELYLNTYQAVSTRPGDLARQNYPIHPNTTLTSPSTPPRPRPATTHPASKGPTP